MTKGGIEMMRRLRGQRNSRRRRPLEKRCTDNRDQRLKCDRRGKLEGNGEEA